MPGLFPLAAHMPAHPVKYVLTVAVFACAGLIPLLQAQVPAPTASPVQSEPEKLPLSNRWTLDQFQTGRNFGKYTGTAGGGMGFNGDAGVFAIDREGKGSFGVEKLAPGGFNRFAPGSTVGNSGGLAPLFPMGSFKRDLSTGADVHFGPNSAALPSLNQIMRGNSILPLNPSFGALKPSYQNTFRPIGNPADLGLTSTSTLFTSPDLGNGVFLSAGTGYGSRSMAGAPAASIGNSVPGGPKHSGTAVNLKLSF
jgi:hypothetical protein